MVVEEAQVVEDLLVIILVPQKFRLEIVRPAVAVELDLTELEELQDLREMMVVLNHLVQVMVHLVEVVLVVLEMVLHVTQ